MLININLKTKIIITKQDHFHSSSRVMRVGFVCENLEENLNVTNVNDFKIDSIFTSTFFFLFILKYVNYSSNSYLLKCIKKAKQNITSTNQFFPFTQCLGLGGLQYTNDHLHIRVLDFIHEAEKKS